MRNGAPASTASTPRPWITLLASSSPALWARVGRGTGGRYPIHQCRVQRPRGVRHACVRHAEDERGGGDAQRDDRHARRARAPPRPARPRARPAPGPRPRRTPRRARRAASSSPPGPRRRARTPAAAPSTSSREPLQVSVGCASAARSCATSSSSGNASATASIRPRAAPRAAASPSATASEQSPRCATASTRGPSISKSPISVPGDSSNDERTTSGTRSRAARSTERACRTGRPGGRASSTRGSRQCGMTRAAGTLRGSAVKTPATSV